MSFSLLFPAWTLGPNAPPGISTRWLLSGLYFVHFCIFALFAFLCFFVFFFLFRQGGCWADGRYQLSQTLKYVEISYERAHMTNWHLSFNTCLYLEEVVWTRYFRKNIPSVCLDIFSGVIPELATGCRSDTLCHQIKQIAWYLISYFDWQRSIKWRSERSFCQFRFLMSQNSE